MKHFLFDRFKIASAKVRKSLEFRVWNFEKSSLSLRKNVQHTLKSPASPGALQSPRCKTPYSPLLIVNFSAKLAILRYFLLSLSPKFEKLAELEMKRIIISTIIVLGILPTYGQEEKKWSLQAGFGEINMLENKYDEGDHFVSEDQGNAFYLSADYWLSQRFALSGGIAFEQQGLYTDYSDGIGLKKVNMLGVSAGAKYYFFPKKWVFQPHIGASIYTNVLNLGHQKGESKVTLDQGYPGSHGVLNYDVQCPALSLSPQIGVDIHLLSSLSLCIDCDYRIGLWGSNKARLRFTDGALTGQTIGIDERNIRSCVSIGLKMDFPVKPVSGKAKDNLLWLIYSWISSESNH